MNLDLVVLNLNSTEKLHLINMDNAYGSVEYYAEHFSDWLADIQADTPDYGDNLIAGLKLALTDWKQYHQQQAAELERIEQKVNEEI